MTTWPVQDAKARFSEMLKASLSQGPQIVTFRGAQAAVLLDVAEWRRLQRQSKPGLKTLLLASEPTMELPLPARGGRRRRRVTAPQD